MGPTSLTMSFTRFLLLALLNISLSSVECEGDMSGLVDKVSRTVTVLGLRVRAHRSNSFMNKRLKTSHSLLRRSFSSHMDCRCSNLEHLWPTAALETMVKEQFCSDGTLLSYFDPIRYLSFFFVAPWASQDLVSVLRPRLWERPADRSRRVRSWDTSACASSRKWEVKCTMSSQETES